MPAPRKGTFAPAHTRKFYLPEATIQRLGGPKAAELMRLLVEDGLDQAAICQQLDIGAAEYQAITLTHAFKRELSAQKRLREHDKKFIEKGEIRGFAGHPNEAKPAETNVPAVLEIKLPKGVSPQEWALKRINQVTPQAVEKLVFLMQNARQESVQYNAAIKILGLNGIVEVEKSISVIADAEAIIRELNKRGPYRKGAEGPVEEDAEIIDAVFNEDRQGSSDPGDSGSLPADSVNEQTDPD